MYIIILNCKDWNNLIRRGNFLRKSLVWNTSYLVTDYNECKHEKISNYNNYLTSELNINTT